MVDKLINALLNTVVGMGTVFLVLIFISFIISLFIYIPKIVAKFSKSEPVQVVEKPAQTIDTTYVEEEKEELVDDTELVAVITAAIYASLGDEVPSDGLVVRSIHKVNKSRWRNA